MPDIATFQGGAMKNAIDQVKGLFVDVNKSNPVSGGVSVNPEDAYESKMSNEEILLLINNWQKEYQIYYAGIEKVQDKSKDYWLGIQKRDITDTLENTDHNVNKIFEAIETFLPIATGTNPEPLVSSDNSVEGQELAKDVKNALVYQAGIQNLKQKLARVTRNWLLSLIGGLEIDYDVDIDDIKTTVINPKRFIFDKDGFVDEAGLFQGDYLGIKYKVSAERLAELFPEHKDYILLLSGSKKGTKIEYIKWWYRGTDVFFTLPNKVLGKFKNPHWNYDGQVDVPDETGGIMKEQVIGNNHLSRPTAPYVFLSIFTLGLRPHDETSLVVQNMPQQDQISKRYKQLDRNIDSQNNGLVVDGRLMTQEQAAEAAGALRRGASIRVQGDPNQVVVQRAAPQLSPDVWQSVAKAEQNLSNIFGTSGSTPSGLKNEETARGKIMVSQSDASRIGGGITEVLEKVASTVYDLYIQMMIVHYDNEHFISILGEDGANTGPLINSRFIRPLRVTVKEGSLVPKDPLTQRNEAIDLWTANAIDPLNLYKKLDFPDPSAATQSLILWQLFQKGAITPEMYLPSFQIETQNAGPIPQSLPGTGDSDLNPPTGQEIPIPPADAGSMEANQAKSKEILNSVPIK